MKKAVRTQRTDGEATYQRILEAAGELFASNGFAETTNKMIAARADVDLASINYHFGSRGGLYEAVLVAAHRYLINIEDLRRIEALEAPARDKLRKLIEGLVGAVVGHRGWQARVLGRELLSPSSHLQVLEQKEILPKLQIVLSLLSEITTIPVGHPALNRCLISIGAPCAMLLVAGRNLPILADPIFGSPRQDLADHLYDFAIGGLEAVARNCNAAHFNGNQG
ncbi:TetR family transcriptional regulator [uncultured Pleomorphomonas sp.]|uniref:TetR family transcriptional regulator n=1 Tax=uncultured Pleomorphomonas sp. TaxID=442121 RepID=A0A212L3B7_9HYPH|nr:CerR family C-terminal domain-containing protein [uncultured Pleomorphomonas sp.]SCM72061.1 TetR family transcriptional regulator [uncultured Pleomorphomonas sp.]